MVEIATAIKEAPTRTLVERADQLRTDHLHPSSRQMYIRLLHGNDLLDPNVKVEAKHTRSLPAHPDEPYSILEREWVDVRQNVTKTVAGWSKGAARSTISLIDSADPAVSNLLKTAFTGWGVPMERDTQLEQEAVAKGFENTFYQQFCGVRGMANLAQRLVETFGNANNIGLQNFGMMQMESEVLLVLDSLTGWLTKFYGKEDMQQAFVACVKAELAVYARQLVPVKQEVLDIPLREDHRGILEKFGRTSETIPADLAQEPIPPRRPVMARPLSGGDVPVVSDALPTPAPVRSEDLSQKPTLAERMVARAQAPVSSASPTVVAVETPNVGKESLPPSSAAPATSPVQKVIPASDLLEPDVVQRLLGKKDNEKPIEGIAPKSPEEIRAERIKEITDEHRKLGDFFAIREQALMAASVLREEPDARIDFDEIHQKLGGSLPNIVQRVIEMSKATTDSMVEQSERVNQIIEESQFLKNTTHNIQNFCLLASYDMRVTMEEVLNRLFGTAIKLPAMDKKIKMEKGGVGFKVRMDEGEVRDFVTKVLRSLGVGEQLLPQYEDWIAQMNNLHLFGDQMHVLLQNQSQLKDEYERVRAEALEAKLAILNGETPEKAFPAGRRTQNQEKEKTVELEDEDMSPPPPAFLGGVNPDAFLL